MSFPASFKLLILASEYSYFSSLLTVWHVSWERRVNSTQKCRLVQNSRAKLQILSCKKTRGARRGSCIHRLHSTVLLCRKYLHCGINFWKENIFIDRVLCTRKLKYSKKLMFKKGMHFGLNLRSVWKLPHQTYTHSSAISFLEV